MRFLLPWLLMCVVAMADPLPASRRIVWQGNVGMPGGYITNRTTVFANVKNAPYNAHGDGSADDTVAIQSAVNACPRGQVVVMPAGLYLTSARLVLTNAITLRGNGSGLNWQTTDTVVSNWNGSDESIVAFGAPTTMNTPYYQYGATHVANITSGDVNKGDTSFTVSSTTGIHQGCLISFDELNDYSILTNWGNDSGGTFFDGCSRQQDGAGTRILAQTVYVTAVNGSTVTFDPPCVWYFSNSLTPQTVAFDCQCEGAILDSIHFIGMSNANSTTANFTFIAAAHCGMTNVESDYADGDHMFDDSSVRCQIEYSYFHDGYKHTSGTTDDTIRHEGHSTGWLFQNNIFRRQHIGFMPLCSAVGNVFAYNFLTNGYDNDSLLSTTVDIEHHGSNPMMNLYEGNVLNIYNQDGVHGTAAYETLLRNFISGHNAFCPPQYGRSPEDTAHYTNQYAAARCINLSGYGVSRFFNVLGNALGTSTMGNYPSFNPIYLAVAPTTRQYDHEGYVWTLGYAQGNDTGTYPGDTTTPYDTYLNHGNWDAVNQSVTYSNAIADHVIPSSYYLAVKPSWFGILPWPPVESTASTNNSLNGMIIPAGYRYLTGQDPQQLSTVSVTIGGGATIGSGTGVCK